MPWRVGASLVISSVLPTSTTEAKWVDLLYSNYSFPKSLKLIGKLLPAGALANRRSTTDVMLPEKVRFISTHR